MKNFNVSEVKISTNGVVRKPAFAKFNRAVNFNNVSILEGKMREKGYREGEPIQVIMAEIEAARKFDVLYDVNGCVIPENKYQNYYLILDGHHRIHAVLQFNEWLKSQGKESIEIPAIAVNLINGETISEYVNEINITKKEWTKEDYLRGSANLFPNEQLLQKFNELVKTEENPNGFPLSSLNQIYCNSKGLTKTDLALLCSGNIRKGNRVKVDIIPTYNIEVGDDYIKNCEDLGFKKSEITKRYLINEFNKLRNAKDSDNAFKVFKTITPDDITIMTDDKGKLMEQKVVDHFPKIVERYLTTIRKESDSIAE